MARYTPITRLDAWAVLLVLVTALVVPSMALACHKGRPHGPHTCGPPDPGPGPGTPSMTVVFDDASSVATENYVQSPSVHSPATAPPPRSCTLSSTSPDGSTGTYTCETVPWPSAVSERIKFHLLDSDVVQTRGKANFLNCIRWDGLGDDPLEPWGFSSAGRLINPDLLFTLTWDSACQDGCTSLITLRFSAMSTQLSQNFVNVADVTLEAVGVIGGGNAGPNPFLENQVIDISEIEITHFAAEKGNIDSVCRWEFAPGDVTMSTTNTTPSP